MPPQMRNFLKHTNSRRSQRLQPGDDDSADVQIGNMSDMSIIILISANDVVLDDPNPLTPSSSSLTTCELCSKRFVKQMLKYHMRSHDSTGKPFQCSHGCPQMFFATNKDLVAHLGKAHKITSNVNEKTRLEKSSKLATSVIPSENSNDTDPKENTRNLRHRHDSAVRAPLLKRRRNVKKKPNGVRSIRTTQTVQQQLKMEQPDSPPAKKKKFVEPSRRSRRCQSTSVGNEAGTTAISEQHGETDKGEVGDDQEMSPPAPTSSATVSATADFDDVTAHVAVHDVEPTKSDTFDAMKPAVDELPIVDKFATESTTSADTPQLLTEENTDEDGEIVVLVQKSEIPQLRPQVRGRRPEPNRQQLRDRSSSPTTTATTCTVCGLMTPGIDQHMNLHDSSRPFQCTDGCVQRFFITKYTLRGHRHDIHNIGNNSVSVVEQHAETNDQEKVTNDQELSSTTSLTMPERSAAADLEVLPSIDSPAVKRMIDVAEAKKPEVDTSELGSTQGESSKSDANESTASTSKGELTEENALDNGEITVSVQKSAPRSQVLPRRPAATGSSLIRPPHRARTRSPTISLSSDDEQPIRMTLTDVKSIERQRKIESVRKRRRLPSLFGSTSSLPTTSATATPSKTTSLPVKMMPATPTTAPETSATTPMSSSATPSSTTPMITSNNVNVPIPPDSPPIVKKKKRSLVQISMHKFLYATSRKKVPPKPEREPNVIIVED